MTTRTKISKAALSHQFEAYHFTGDDGHPAQRVFSPVFVDTVDGRSFYLPMGRRVVDDEGGVGYVARYDAAEMLARVEAAGDIDAALWVEVQEDEPLEDRLAPYGSEWQREQEDRA